MEISGKIIQVLPERSGVSQRSGTEWKCAGYVIETFEQYPRKCFFEVFGTDRIQQLNIQAGQSLTVSFDIDAHEYNGRWFNSLRAWKAVPYDPNAVAAPAIPGAIPEAAMPGAAMPGTPNPFAAQPAADPLAAQQSAPFPPAQAVAPATDTPAPTPAFGGEGTDDLPF